MNVLSVKSILQELDDVVSDGILGREPLGPCEKSALVQGGLLDRETGRSRACFSFQTAESKAVRSLT